jgi:hypothetical protein
VGLRPWRPVEGGSLAAGKASPQLMVTAVLSIATVTVA